MNHSTGKPDHIQDWLASQHKGQWFGFAKGKSQVYANLVIHDDSKDKPTEKECTDGLKAMQDAWEAKQYARDRRLAYPRVGDQLDMIYHDKVDGTTTWQTAIKKVKDDNPKP
jgi:hypothetical protein